MVCNREKESIPYRNACMKNSFLLRMASVAVVVLLYIHASAQVPELKINDKIDPQVYLSKLSIDVKVIGNRAVTTMTMVFTNKSNRLLEGAGQLLWRPAGKDQRASYCDGRDIHSLCRRKGG